MSLEGPWHLRLRPTLHAAFGGGRDDEPQLACPFLALRPKGIPGIKFFFFLRECWQVKQDRQRWFASNPVPSSPSSLNFWPWASPWLRAAFPLVNLPAKTLLHFKVRFYPSSVNNEVFISFDSERPMNLPLSGFDFSPSRIPYPFS